MLNRECNAQQFNNYLSVYYPSCVFCSYVLCSLKCATLCTQMLMCFNKLLSFECSYKGFVPNRQQAFT